MATQVITFNELLALVREGIEPTSPQKGARYITADGEIHPGYPKTEQRGYFDGRAGSQVRSRKGAVRRLANGRRSYIADTGVIAYVPRGIS